MTRKGTVSVKFDPAKTIAKLNGQAKLAHANKVYAAMVFATKTALDATPAWSGDTRANFKWAIGRAGSDYTPYNQGYSWRAKMFPTNPKGADARSMASVEAMRSAVYKDPYRKYVLYNPVQYEDGMNIRDLEYGTLTGVAHMPLSKARQALKARLG